MSSGLVIDACPRCKRHTLIQLRGSTLACRVCGWSTDKPLPAPPKNPPGRVRVPGK